MKSYVSPTTEVCPERAGIFCGGVCSLFVFYIFLYYTYDIIVECR